MEVGPLCPPCYFVLDNTLLYILRCLIVLLSFSLRR